MDDRYKYSINIAHLIIDHVDLLPSSGHRGELQRFGFSLAGKKNQKMQTYVGKMPLKICTRAKLT